MNRKLFTLCTWLGMLLVLPLGSTARLYGQLAVTTATLSGSVADSSGAIIPQATITITSTEKGITRNATSNAHGSYSFTQLPPSTYTLSVTANGFTTYKQTGIVLDAAQTATQNVTLNVGAVSQEVVVNSQASQLNTDNANIATSINAKQVVELPLNLRNVYGLATLNSSVQNGTETQGLLGGGPNGTDNADQDISFLNFAGGFFGTSAYLLDGGWDTDPQWGAVIYVPSVDAVQEFRVQNNSFTAQYGWSTGNVVNVVTKSGTSGFHGDVYEFFRNDALDANSWFNNHNGVARLSFGRNQFGGSAGGPLYLPHLYRQKDKTFIFGLYEGLRLTTPINQTFTVPTAAYKAGDFSAQLGAQGTINVGTDQNPDYVPAVDALGRPIRIGQIYNPRSTRTITAGQVDPRTGLVARRSGYIRDPIANNNVAALGAFDPIAVKLLSFYPSPTGPGLSNNFFGSGSAPAVSNEYLIRVDHNFNNNIRGFFRYSYKSETKTGNPAYWGADNPAGPGNQRPNNRYNMAAGYSQIFSPTFTMNVQAGVGIWHESSNNQSLGFQPSTLGLPTYFDANSPQFPNIYVGGQSALGPTNDQYTVNHGPVGSVAVDFIKTAGRHTINFGVMGVELEDDEKSTTRSSVTANGNFTSGPDPNNAVPFNTGSGTAQLLLGVLDGGFTGTPYNPAVAIHYFGGYVQDDWRPLPKLVLNLGLRYEVQTAPTYRHNIASTFNPNAVNPVSAALGKTVLGAVQFLSPDQRGIYKTAYTNVAPRIGFSYAAMPHLAFRGGYGIFYPPSITCCFPGGRDGFAPTTTAPTTLSNNVSPNPAVTLANPFPNGYTPVSGNALGGMQQVGSALGESFLNRKSPYVQQYMVGLQWGITQNDLLDVNYVGNHGTHMVAQYIVENQLNPSYLSLGADALNSQVANPYYGAIPLGTSYCNLDQPTVSQAQLLQPYSQYCYINQQNAPIGFSIYNALQAQYTHRVSQGLTATVSYTYSKFLDNVEGNQAWAYAGNSSPANTYNLAAEKSVDGSDTPHSLVANYVYQIPVGRGRTFGSHLNKAVNAVVGGWEVSQIATFRSGLPLAITGANYNSYGGNPRPDVTANPHIANRTIQEWFNTGAFAFAKFGTFGTAPRYFSNLRGPHYQNWDTNLSKNWQFTETMRVQFRAELYNTFNHPQFYTPNTGYGGCDPNSAAAISTGSCPSSFGQITNTFPSRSVQFAGKFYW